MSLKTMEDLFIHGLKDIYYAEKKLVQQLPKMAKKAESPELAKAILRKWNGADCVERRQKTRGGGL